MEIGLGGVALSRLEMARLPPHSNERPSCVEATLTMDWISGKSGIEHDYGQLRRGVAGDDAVANCADARGWASMPSFL